VFEDGCGEALSPVENNYSSTLMVGASIGTGDDKISSISPVYSGEITDFRIGIDKTKWDEVFTAPTTDDSA
jgi:hypothetical protein